MNLILLHPEDFISPATAVVRDRRRDHIRTVHRAGCGDNLRVGLINGPMGSGQITHSSVDRIELAVSLDQAPPPPLNVTLILALPRPKMLRRVLQSISAMGVKHIYLINSYRVDKSFWKSPLLTTDKLTEQLLLGLEQARDTIVPNVYLRPRFKPFVEDELPVLSEDCSNFVAHPGNYPLCPHGCHGKITLAIGPEGGFIDYEINKFMSCQFTPVSLGERILRVETAVPVLLSRFYQ